MGSSFSKRRNLGKRLNSSTENLRHSRSEDHTSELQSQSNLVCRLLLEKKHHPPLPREPERGRVRGRTADGRLRSRVSPDHYQPTLACRARVLTGVCVYSIRGHPASAYG